MPWKETNVEEERLKFIAECIRGESSMTDICMAFGISRKTGYKIINRFTQEGISALKSRSRATKSKPNLTEARIEGLIIKTRDSHPRLGAKKLLPFLAKKYPEIESWPAVSTVGEILKRNKRIKKTRRRVTHHKTAHNRLRNAEYPNSVWCVDFKGWFSVGDGTRCDPLTISDLYSRYILECSTMKNIGYEEVKKHFIKAFKEFGLPEAIRSDNGPPFATVGIFRFSKLSIWWKKLGIDIELIQPGHPEQNGVHERMHRTLKEECARPPKANIAAQQRAFSK